MALVFYLIFIILFYSHFLFYYFILFFTVIFIFFTFNVFICEILERCLSRQLKSRLYSINNDDIYSKKQELKRQYWVRRKEIKARFITQGFSINKTESRRNYRKRNLLDFSKLFMYWTYFINPIFRIFLIVSQDYQVNDRIHLKSDSPRMPISPIMLK